MSNIINAYIDEKSILTVEDAEGFSGEHNAEILEISLGEFAAGDYDYYILSFSNSRIAGKQVSNEIRTANDKPIYIDGEKIYCPLTSELTCTGRLKFQLEAHKSTEGEEVIKKTSVAEIRFKPSIMGIEDYLSADAPSLIRLIQLEKRLSELEELHGIDINSISNQLESKIDDLRQFHSSEIAAYESEFNSKLEETNQKHNSDIDNVNSELEKLSVVPFATEKTCGGFVLRENSHLRLNNGIPFINYKNLDIRVMGLLAISAMLDGQGGNNTFVFETVQEANEQLESVCADLMSGIFDNAVISVIEQGELVYQDEMYEFHTVFVPFCSISVIEYVDDKIVFTNYPAEKFRELLIEGI